MVCLFVHLRTYVVTYIVVCDTYVRTYVIVCFCYFICLLVCVVRVTYVHLDLFVYVFVDLIVLFACVFCVHLRGAIGLLRINVISVDLLCFFIFTAIPRVLKGPYGTESKLEVLIYVRTWLALPTLVAYSLARRKETVVAGLCVRLQAIEVVRRTYAVIGMEKQYDENVAVKIEIKCR